MAIRPTAPKVQRKLPCVLTPEEIQAAKDLTTLLTKEYDDTEKEKKGVTAGYTERLKSLRERKGQQAEMAVTGIEERHVDCEWEIIREDGVARLIRCDTMEYVPGEERELTAEEMQPRLSMSYGDDEHER